MGLIKSTFAPAQLSRFSLRDIEQEAESILLRARMKAEELLRQAQIEAVQLKNTATQQGLAEGTATGLERGTTQGRKNGYETALAEHRVQFADTVKTLIATVASLERSRN